MTYNYLMLFMLFNVLLLLVFSLEDEDSPSLHAASHEQRGLSQAELRIPHYDRAGSEEDRLFIREQVYGKWSESSTPLLLNPNKIVPTSTPWVELLTSRLVQLESNPSRDQRWEGMMSWSGSAFLKNFTSLGYAKTKAPSHLIEKLKEKLVEAGVGQGRNGR
jgi:hypothetical protein